MKKKKISKNLPDGRTDEEMFDERISAHPDPEDMIFTKLGDPRPRLLPNNDIITDPDTIRKTANMTDDEVMAWLDHRAPEIRFDNGVTITQGELDDMPDESREAFISNMLESEAEDIT